MSCLRHCSSNMEIVFAKDAYVSALHNSLQLPNRLTLGGYKYVPKTNKVPRKVIIIIMLQKYE